MNQRRAGRFFLILGMCLVSVFCLSHQRNSEVGDGQSITILVLNGKTGKPVENEKVNVWLGEAKDAVFLETDSNGKIQLRIGSNQEKTLRFLPNWYVDCRYGKNGPQLMNLKFFLDDIVSQGVVAENFCGHVSSKASPGTLVIYVRKPSFMEAFRR